MVRFIPILILFLSISVFAQSIKVRSAKMGKAMITSGKVSSVINLSKDISGCFLRYDGSDSKSKKSDVTSFDVVDSVRKKSAVYLVLLATTGGNCNVQGECGATEDWTLVWLKLGKNLKVLAKKAVPIQSCRYERIDLESGFDGEENSSVKLTNGELKVEYSENRYDESEPYKFFTLTYKKVEAEKGFTIVSEKRERPKN